MKNDFLSYEIFNIFHIQIFKIESSTHRTIIFLLLIQIRRHVGKEIINTFYIDIFQNINFCISYNIVD